MLGLCIALLTYGLTMWSPTHVSPILESLITPTHQPKQKAIKTDSKHNTNLPTLTPTNNPIPLHETVTDKQSAMNEASENVLQSVSKNAVEHSPVLIPCETECDNKKEVKPTETPTPTPTQIPEPKEITPTSYPTIMPCDWDYKISRNNYQGKPDFVEIPVMPCPL